MMQSDRDLGPGSTGERVRRLHDALQRLGIQLPTAEVREERYGDETRRAVQALQTIFEKNLNGEAVEKGVVGKATVALIDGLIARLPSAPQPDANAYRISGTVETLEGARLARCVVTIAQQGLQGATNLGSAHSEADGSFSFEYRRPGAERPQRGAEGGMARDIAAAPPLRLSVLDADRRERQLRVLLLIEGGNEIPVERLAEREDAPFVIRSGGRNVRVRVIVDAPAGINPPSELEEVEALLAPLMQGLPYESLREETGNFQVSYLVSETGVARPIVDRLIASARARQLAAEHGQDVPLWAFYGLGHAGLPVELAPLARMPRAGIVVGLRKAITDAVIPAGLENEVERIADKISVAGAAEQLRERLGEAGGTSADWLALAGLEEDAQKHLLLALAKSDADDDTFWSRLRDDPAMGGADGVRRAEMVLRIGEMCGGHLGLARELLRERVRDIVSAADLARLEEDTWLAAVERAGVSPPVSSPGSEAQAPSAWRRRLAKSLMRAAQLAFPTAAIEQMVARQSTELGLQSETAQWLSEIRRTAEAGSVPPFDLRTVHIDRYFAKNGQQVEVRDAERLRSDLKRLQRTLLVAEDPAYITSLLRKGHDSALKVAHFSGTAFADAHADTIGRDAASAIHARARQIHMAHLFVHLTVGNAIATSRKSATGGA